MQTPEENTTRGLSFILSRGRQLGLQQDTEYQQQQEEKRRFLPHNTIGQRCTNKIHKRQRITSHINTPETLQ